MSTHKFACPLCSQHIECEDQYAGMQIKCPICQGDILIPPLPSTPAPPMRVTLHATHSAAPKPSPTPASSHISSRGQHETDDSADEGSGSKIKRFAIIGVVVLVALPGLYFGFSAISRMQAKWNENRKKDDDPGVLGGQMGHIAELYSVLDATDPDRQSRRSEADEVEPGRVGSGKSRASRSVAVGAGGAGQDSSAALGNLPVIAPSWTLDLATANIPESKVNGKISGTNFVVDSAWLFTGGATPILSLRQGTNGSPDRELLVYLRLKAGETLAGKTWNVTKTERTGVPQVVKKWKTNPKYAAQQKPFPSGYAMRLELGQAEDDTLPGKIYVALPDTDQSVVAGLFQATIRVVTAQARPTASPNFDWSE